MDLHSKQTTVLDTHHKALLAANQHDGCNEIESDLFNGPSHNLDFSSSVGSDRYQTFWPFTREAYL